MVGHKFLVPTIPYNTFWIQKTRVSPRIYHCNLNAHVLDRFKPIRYQNDCKNHRLTQQPKGEYKVRTTAMEKTAHNIQEAFAIMGIMQRPKPYPLAKQCACGLSYTRRAFLRLAIPAGGDHMHGLIWRQCSCGSTITIKDPDNA